MLRRHLTVAVHLHHHVASHFERPAVAEHRRAADETEINSETDGAGKKRRRALFALARRPLVRELLVVLAFCAFTAALTWPYATRLRDAVVDPGDPYLVSWILWWDYHATFTNP